MAIEMMSDVKISVVMSNYNHAKYIGRALDNLLEMQEYFCEILVLDDFSSDNSMEVLNVYAGKNPLIKVICNEQNMGVSFSYNRLFREASGDYIVQQAADDYLLSEGMKKILNVVQNHSGMGYYCGNYYQDILKTKERKSILHYYPEGEITPREIKRKMKGQGLAPIGNVILRKAILEFGGYRQEILWHADWFMNSAIVTKYGMCFVPTFAGVMVLYDTSYGASRLDWQKNQKSMAAIIHILQNEYATTLYPEFIANDTLNQQGWHMFRYWVFNVKLWDRNIFRFAVSFLCQRFRWVLLPKLLPTFFKNNYRILRDVCRCKR